MRKHRYLRTLVVLLLIAFQLAFLALILKEHYSAPIIVVLFLLIGVGTGFAHLKMQWHQEEYHYEDFWVAVWVPVGAAACYFLSTKAGLGNVIGAGITGTVGSCLPSLYLKGVYLKKVPLAVYCGAFVGMCSTEVAPDVGFVLGAGVVAGALLLLSKSLFSGVGGKLGLLAFSGVVTMAFLFYLLKIPA